MEPSQGRLPRTTSPPSMVLVPLVTEKTDELGFTADPSPHQTCSQASGSEFYLGPQPPPTLPA